MSENMAMDLLNTRKSRVEINIDNDHLRELGEFF